MASVTRFITGQEPTQEHEFAIFISLIWSLLQNKKKTKTENLTKLSLHRSCEKFTGYVLLLQVTCKTKMAKTKRHGVISIQVIKYLFKHLSNLILQFGNLSKTDDIMAKQWRHR